MLRRYSLVSYSNNKWAHQTYQYENWTVYSIYQLCQTDNRKKGGKLLKFVSQSIEIHLASFNDHSNAVLLSWPTLASWILYLGYLFGQTIVTSCYQASIKSLSKNIHVTWSTAACILTRTNEGNHISFILLSLHWLPGKFRLEFKIPLLICKTLNDKLYHVLMSS